MRRGDKIMTLEELRQKQIDLVGFNCYDENDCLEAVRKDGCVLRYVIEQTPEICLEAVRKDGWVLRYVNSNILPLIADKL